MKRRFHILMKGVRAHVRPKSSSHPALLFHRLQKGGFRGSGKSGKLQHQKADHAASDHHHLMAGADAAQIDAMKAAGHRLRHRSLLKSGVVPQPVYLSGLHRTVFRKAAVHRGAIADHMLTVMPHALPAGRTGAAHAVGIDADPVSGFIIRYLFSRLNDHA